VLVFVFPLTYRIYSQEKGLKINHDEYNEAELKAKEASKAVKEGAAGSVALDVHAIAELQKKGIKPTNDQAKYTDLSWSGKILAIYSGGAFVEGVSTQSTHELFGVVLDQTNFYAEQGGQTFDKGTIEIGDKVEIAVENVQVYGGFVLHVGYLKHGSIQLGDSVTTVIDGEKN